CFLVCHLELLRTLLLGGRLLGRGLLRGGFLGRSLVVRSSFLLRRRLLGGRLFLVGLLGGRGLLDRLSLLRLIFLVRLDALGGLGLLGLVLLGNLDRGLLGLRSGILLRRGGLLLDLRIADLDDAQQGQLLAVAGLAAIVVPTALLEHRDLFALRLGDDLGRDLDLGRVLDFAAVAGQQDVAQLNRIDRFPRILLDRDLVSGGNAILLAARAHYCEHGHFIRSFRLPFATRIWQRDPQTTKRAPSRAPERAQPLGEVPGAVNASSGANSAACCLKAPCL